MTDPDAPDPINPNEAVVPERVRIDESPQRKRTDFLPLLYLLGFLVLAGSLFYLWQNPSLPAGAQQDAARVDTLQDQLQSVTNRLTQLEQRPTPVPPPSLGPLEARIATLERRPTATATPTDLGPLTARLDSASSKQTADLQSVTTRLDAIDGRLGAAEKQQASDLPGINTRLDAIDGRLAAAEKQQASDMQGVATRLDGTDTRLAAAEKQQASGLQSVSAQLDGRLNTMESRLAAVEKQGGGIAGEINGITERQQRGSRIQAAAAALEAGQKLGEIPGAPPALAQFAHDVPPTEAGLRLSFSQAAEAAQRASQPAIMDNQPFASRLWTRAQQAVTVRQGDRVLLGDPVSGVLAHARQALDAGDLAGALAALKGLGGPAAAAMADWVGQAQALLDARAALTSMAARG